MFTQVKTPQDIFFNPQRFLVPLFQRPYVWNQELQWQPLWDDVRRVAERIELTGTSTPHFLGAVVLQQQPAELGTLGVRTVIDGQQRLTTLQLFLDAIHDQLQARGFTGIAKQVQDLVENPEHFRKTPEDAFKVWPTNRDRPAFNKVMSMEVPGNYTAIDEGESRIVRAHQYFSNEVDLWLSAGNSEIRGNALASAVTHFLQIVVIDLLTEEDAQEIFETLNARGTPLTAADLIKNFVFQRLDGTPEEAERTYHLYWQLFETPFWETEISSGRIKYTRSSLFLTHWLIAQTRQDFTIREVFSRFKLYVTEQSDPVDELIPRLHRAALEFQKVTEGSLRQTGSLSRTELFVYRTSTLDSEVVKPLLLWLIDPELEPIEDDQLNRVLNSVESWLVRRAIVKATTALYNKFLLDLLIELAKHPRQQAGDVTEAFLAKQSSPSTYWPADEEIRHELTTQPIYRRLVRSRLRMILEAIEDKRRGFTATVGGRLTESCVSRNDTSIEHIMPQEWRANWAGPEFDDRGVNRDQLVHMLGNLTLLTQGLNSANSNLHWNSKKEKFREHTTLLMTADLVNKTTGDWDSEDIHSRSENLASEVIEIWPVPASNVGLLETGEKSKGTTVSVSDLIQAGLLEPGQTIYARTQAHRGRQASVSEDGGIYVDGVRHETLSGAAKFVTKSYSEAGWWFWVTDLQNSIALSDLREEYLSSLEIQETNEDSDDDSPNLVPLNEALREKNFPLENLTFLKNLQYSVDSLGCEILDTYIKVLRPDGLPTLDIHYGFTTGFQSPEEIVSIFGDVDYWESKRLAGTWGVSHPVNRIRESGGTHSSAGKEQVPCPQCGMLMSSAQNCEFCD